MRTFRRAICFVVANVFVIAACFTAFSQPSISKILIKQAKSGEYDTLILGQSHTETSIDPFLLSDEMDCNAFNLGRRLTPIQNMYYYLKESNKKHTYKTAIVDIDFTYWTSKSKYAGSDNYLLPNLSGDCKLEYFKNEALPSNFGDTLFPYKISSDFLKKAKENLSVKLMPEYYNTYNDDMVRTIQEKTGVGQNYNYIGRGFRYGVSKSGVVWNSEKFVKNDDLYDNLEYMDKLVDYCNENGIKLVFIQSVLPPQRIKNENIDEVHEFFSAECDKRNVPFYDMNYLKQEYLSKSDDYYVDIDGHMLGEYAEIHTSALAKVLSSASPEDMFYTNYFELLKSLEH